MKSEGFFMFIRAMQVGQIGTNCYILGDEATKTCAVIDPGEDGSYLLSQLRTLEYTPVAILLTHAHFDHILAVPALREAFSNIPVYAHRLETAGQQRTENIFGMTVPTLSSMGVITPYDEGDTVTIGGLTVEVLHTPGHSAGSVTLKVEDVLFTGDTLFRGSCGRTDLPGGDHKVILQSLKRLAELEGDYKVYPGHESSSTLDYERKVNYYMLDALGK
jgi:hydroxyacylglutathione hydrolase